MGGGGKPKNIESKCSFWPQVAKDSFTLFIYVRPSSKQTQVQFTTWQQPPSVLYSGNCFDLVFSLLCSRPDKDDGKKNEERAGVKKKGE